ncbi:hypothetical protein F0562_036107 [Nyssa sinensis]|uniref:Uncharacterized protein n=1 Tax=Nyssa sinensis TaxID=561372 RepID=A0A5J5AFY5_9ASTE|nr:hypothetical protein F0562_036107 [Nyssa sinensis]
MKDSRANSAHNHYSLPTDFREFDEDDIEVADILLNLPYLISESESRRRFQITWGSKGRRSALYGNQSPLLRLPLRPSSSPFLQRTCQVEIETDTERIPKVKVESTSPATPLSFSPSESDDKPKHSHNKSSKKRTREELLKTIDELTRRRELLSGEVGTVRSYCDKLKAFNLVLKAKKQELSSYHKKERKSHSEIIKSSNLGIENQEDCQFPFMLHHQPFIVDQTVDGSQVCGKFQYPYGQMSILLSSSLGEVSHMAPLVIPDLNAPAEETFAMYSSRPFDQDRALAEKKAKAAAARMRRRIKIKEKEKEKNSSVAIKPPSFK